MNALALVAGSAFAVSTLATFGVRGMARRLGAVATPRPDRWSHRPTALFGGAGIALATLTALLVGGLWHEPEVILLIGASGLFVVGLADDTWDLRPRTKLVAQLLAAALVLGFDLTVRGTGIWAVDAALTILWVVGITNAVNLLDNMDGLAGGVVAFAAAALAFLLALDGQDEPAIAAAAIGGAVIGFLVFNVSPASIFMGDCGSMFLGYWIAGLALLGEHVRTGSSAVPFAVPTLVLLVPILDTTLVVVSRVLAGRPVFEGGCDHTSHRLVALGLSERAAVLFLWAIAAASGGLAILVRLGSASTTVASSVPLLIVAVFVGIHAGAGYPRRHSADRREDVDVPGLRDDGGGRGPPFRRHEALEDLHREHEGLPAAIRHAFTVDVEDWYHGIPVGPAVRAAAERRLDRSVGRLLDLLAEHDTRATFFLLGPIAKEDPGLVKRIAAGGHELGCHGWSHDLLYEMTPDRFRQETRMARDVIEDTVGAGVHAYRAAYFSITKRSLWALEVLAELGFRYDSSIFPVRNWRYGIPDFSPWPQRIETAAGPIYELPMSVRHVLGVGLPLSGGAYFRLYPYAITRANLRYTERAGLPAVFYLHPWELDQDHPRVPFHWKAKLTHYARLRSTGPKLSRMLRDFRFGPLGDVLEHAAASRVGGPWPSNRKHRPC